MTRRRSASQPPPSLGARVFSAGSETMAILEFPLEGGRSSPLTRAEHVILLELLRGRSNRTIAGARGVSERTVATQVADILRKLGVRSRADLAARLPAILFRAPESPRES